MQMFCQAVNEQPSAAGLGWPVRGQLPQHSGVGSGSCHSKEQGLLWHKEVFDRERQSWSESRPWAGSQGAPSPPAPPSMGRGALHPSADQQGSPRK